MADPLLSYWDVLRGLGGDIAFLAAVGHSDIESILIRVYKATDANTSRVSKKVSQSHKKPRTALEKMALAGKQANKLKLAACLAVSANLSFIVLDLKLTKEFSQLRKNRMQVFWQRMKVC